MTNGMPKGPLAVCDHLLALAESLCGETDEAERLYLAFCSCVNAAHEIGDRVGDEWFCDTFANEFLRLRVLAAEDDQ